MDRRVYGAQLNNLAAHTRDKTSVGSSPTGAELSTDPRRGHNALSDSVYQIAGLSQKRIATQLPVE